MEYSLANLIKHSAEVPAIQRKIASAVIKYAQSVEDRGIAAEAVNESIKIDVLELESLTNPSRFNYEDVEIGRVEV